ncbi:MAG: Gfo/Idh/MocA family oxidoreductase [Anaerolineales bacterium]|nr:Gfo/Idh/MocA family oxidoreductase [Anaerolineales bacterium]
MRNQSRNPYEWEHCVTTDKFRWGILGTGAIARKFATGIAALEDHSVVAAGSRTRAAADRFGDEFDVPHRHASYEALVNDPDVDAIYVATPHSLHRDNTLLALHHGKPVLCEKPFAINAIQAAEMVWEARRQNLFLMEAMWTRCLPIVAELRRLVADGAIGELRMVQADFGFRTGFDPAGRLFDPALGGGALLDVGIYPVSLAHMLLGRPTRIMALAELSPNGIDTQTGILLGYPSGPLAVLSTAVATDTPWEATILGTTGWIRLHSPWWVSDTLTLHRAGAEPEQIQRPYIGNGYSHEALEVARCVRAGILESPIMPLDETIAIMQTLDAIRTNLGIHYPME